MIGDLRHLTQSVLCQIDPFDFLRITSLGCIKGGLIERRVAKVVVILGSSRSKPFSVHCSDTLQIIFGCATHATSKSLP